MPISFTCPSCGKQTEVGDQYAGQSGPCAACGQTVNVPTQAGPPPKKGTNTLTIVVAVCLGTVVLCGGGLMALLSPGISASSNSARQSACINNVKQISLAMLTYEAMHGKFPSAYTVDEDGKPMYSWRVLLLPYIEERDLYERFNLDEPWDSPHNLALASQMPAIYACPSSADAEENHTSYVMIVGPNTVSDGPDSKGIDYLTRKDGASTTIMLIESAESGRGWTEPIDLNANEISYQINDGSGKGIRSNHRSGVTVGFCDGHVIIVDKEIDPLALEDMATVNNCEDPNYIIRPDIVP